MPSCHIAILPSCQIAKLQVAKLWTCDHGAKSLSFLFFFKYSIYIVNEGLENESDKRRLRKICTVHLFSNSLPILYTIKRFSWTLNWIVFPPALWNRIKFSLLVFWGGIHIWNEWDKKRSLYPLQASQSQQPKGAFNN